MLEQMYRDRFTRIADIIENNPKNFNYQNWANSTTANRERRTASDIMRHPCGTVCCIGGFANVCKIYDELGWDAVIFEADNSTSDIDFLYDEEVAGKWLGLNLAQWSSLFYGNWHPRRLLADPAAIIAKLREIAATGVVNLTISQMGDDVEL